jgi:hypothetical protein
MWRLLALIFGILITSWGIVFNIISLSYFDMGQDFLSVFLLILTKYENYLTIIGTIMLVYALKKRRRKF